MGRIAAVAERRVVLRHRQRGDRVELWRYVLTGDLATVLTSPVIYSLIVPFMILDAWVWLYQAVCFRAWGLARVRRSLRSLRGGLKR